MEKSIVKYISAALSDMMQASELRDVSLWLAEYVTGLNRTEILTGKDSDFFSLSKTSDLERLNNYIRKLREGEPLPYIVGSTSWRGLELNVNQSTLIPRPETAELVDWIISDNTNLTDLTIVDWCTGSGCIAIALKKHKSSWCIRGYDISEQAISVARQNALINECEIDFEKKDIFLSCSVSDILVANPPYVFESEKATMEASVLRWEPHSALFVPDNDNILFYRTILTRMRARTYYFEINPLAVENLTLLCTELGFSAEYRYDYAGKCRFLKCQNHNEKT